MSFNRSSNLKGKVKHVNNQLPSPFSCKQWEFNVLVLFFSSGVGRFQLLPLWIVRSGSVVRRPQPEEDAVSTAAWFGQGPENGCLPQIVVQPLQCSPNVNVKIQTHRVIGPLLKQSTDTEVLGGRYHYIVMVYKYQQFLC